jgi:hypothetical protein
VRLGAVSRSIHQRAARILRELDKFHWVAARRLGGGLFGLVRGSGGEGVFGHNRSPERRRAPRGPLRGWGERHLRCRAAASLIARAAVGGAAAQQRGVSLNNMARNAAIVNKYLSTTRSLAVRLLAIFAYPGASRAFMSYWPNSALKLRRGGFAVGHGPGDEQAARAEFSRRRGGAATGVRLSSCSSNRRRETCAGLSLPSL